MIEEFLMKAMDMLMFIVICILVFRGLIWINDVKKTSE